MFDLIPLQSYGPFYFYVMLFVVVITFFWTQTSSLFSRKGRSFQRGMGVFILLFTLLYIGFRPINGVFLDMMTYNRMFERYASGEAITTDKDLFFHYFTKYASQIMSADFYFFLCAAVYIIPLFLVSKKWFKANWFLGFLFMVTAFSFWNFATNGIRNGMAGSVFLLGVSQKKRIGQILVIFLAINFHKTMLLPAMAFAASFFINKPKLMIVIWITCIPLSLAAGGVFENLIAGIGFGDDRLSYLTDEVDSGRFSSVGFRWDFLLYSATAVAAGWYFIIKKKYQDPIYLQLFTTYVLTNAFWILVIRANFSNRFAYLSWFMLGFVIIYPLLKKKMVKDQQKLIGLILLIYFSFTFLLNVILK